MVQKYNLGSKFSINFRYFIKICSQRSMDTLNRCSLHHFQISLQMFKLVLEYDMGSFKCKLDTKCKAQRKVHKLPQHKKCFRLNLHVCFYQVHNIILLHSASPIQCSPFIAGSNIKVGTKIEQLLSCINTAPACSHHQRSYWCLGMLIRNIISILMPF